MKSHYSVSIVNRVICLIDKDQGASITNTAEQVVQELKAAGYDIDRLPVIYRDTMGHWDWLQIKAGEFVKFRSLAVDGQITKQQGLAIAQVKKLSGTRRKHFVIVHGHDFTDNSEAVERLNSLAQSHGISYTLQTHSIVNEELRKEYEICAIDYVAMGRPGLDTLIRVIIQEST